MYHIFLFISFSFCQKQINESLGFWNLSCIKKLQKSQTFQSVLSLFHSFPPNNDHTNFASIILNDFRDSLISYKRSYLIKHQPKYLLHKSKNVLLRKVWGTANEMKKKGEVIPDKIKKILSSFKPQNKLENFKL